MTDKKQPESLRLAELLEYICPNLQTASEAAAELRRLHAENESLRAERERILHSIRVSNEIINEKNDELESLRTGYDAARLEIESLRARSAQPAGEYPTLPLAITSAPERIWLDLGFNPWEEDAHFSNLHQPTWSADNATGDGIEYVRADRAMRAAQPAGAQQPGAGASHGQAPAQVAPVQANTKTHDLLSTMIGMFLGFKDEIGYKPGSVIDKTVSEAVEHLKDWPYPDTAQAAPAAMAEPVEWREFPPSSAKGVAL